MPHVPAATCIALCHNLATVGFDHAPVLENFRLLQPLALRDDELQVAVEIGTSDDAVILTGRSHLPHFACSARHASAGPMPNPPALGSAEKTLSREQFYDGELFFHGPTFQIIDRIMTGADGLLWSEIDGLHSASLYGVGQYDRLTLLLDAAFQTMAFDALQRFDVAALPVGFARMRASGLPSGCRGVKVKSSGIELIGDEVVADIHVWDGANTAIICLEQARLRVLREATMSR